MTDYTCKLISVDEYLHTSYDPDCDYVDGVIEKRNVGELPHSDLQSEIVHYFRTRRKQLGVYAFTELRVKVGATRCRIPDICIVVGSKPTEPVLTTPPFIVIEVLFSEDRMSRVKVRLNDFLRCGVRYVWVVDPETCKAQAYTQDGLKEAQDGVLRTQYPEIALPLAEIFAEL